MSVLHKILTAIILSATASGLSSLSAQELNCTVEINSDQVEGTYKDVFTTLQQAINDYMNTTKFSQAQIAVNEKIECRLFFTVKSYSDDTFSGDLQIQSSRPVYNTSYTTTLINFKDSKIEFTYRENEPLIYSETQMESNLMAILNFYAYLIMAVDFDSFSPNGGQQFYDRAKQIVQMAQSSGESGWKAFEDTKNRSSVLDGFTQPSTSDIRTLLYQYHRNGLDEMALSPDKGRAKITASLDILKKIYQVAPMSVMLSMFKDAKFDELVNLYTKSSQTERDNVYELLYGLYPTEGTRLNMIKKGVNK
jgi:hypothetical protein